jgi:hypothetical protein
LGQALHGQPREVLGWAGLARSGLWLLPVSLLSFAQAVGSGRMGELCGVGLSAAVGSRDWEVIGEWSGDYDSAARPEDTLLPQAHGRTWREPTRTEAKAVAETALPEEASAVPRALPPSLILCESAPTGTPVPSPNVD